MFLQLLVSLKSPGMQFVTCLYYKYLGKKYWGETFCDRCRCEREGLQRAGSSYGAHLSYLISLPKPQGKYDIMCIVPLSTEESQSTI